MSKPKTHPFLRDFTIHVDPRYEIESHIVEYGMWEPHVVGAIQYLVEPGFVCADVGANAGYHSLAMAQRGAHVLAFEPDSENFSRLTQNLHLNPQVVERMTLFKQGLSDKPGKLKVFQSGDQEHRGNSYLSETIDPQKWTNTGGAEPEMCTVSTLDEVLNGGRIDFIKVDVEGMELEVLKGGKRSIERFSPSIIFESLMTESEAPKSLAVQEFLLPLGYHLFFVDLEKYHLNPTLYPAFKHDTVAIHASKLAQHLHLMNVPTG